MTPHESPEVMDPKQVAAYLGVGKGTIERWRQNEGLPTVKIGSLVRFRRAAVDAWLAEFETRKAHTPEPVDVPVRRPRKQRAY